MNRPQLREAGDSALLLQLAPVIDPAVNAQAIAIADAIRHRDLLGVRDVVSTFRSVAVYFDPLKADVDEISRALRVAVSAAPISNIGRRHEIPVAYGAEHGPDLDEVATRAGLSSAEVIARHAGVDYRVFMLGFQPGFAYMGLVDPSIASPRRESPRVRVPAGAVGIAGRQTGIYPSSTPGGWQIIGRALEPVFDAGKTPAARFAPGDMVTFKPASAGSPPLLNEIVAPTVPKGMHRVTVLCPGLFTTIQDLGIWGQQGLGVPVSGAMDTFSHAVANLSVGNPRHAASLEATITGPELRFEQQTTIALSGADMAATLDGVAVPMQRPVICAAGSILRFGARRRGARTYIAMAGGLMREHRYTVRPIAEAEEIAVGPSVTTTVRGDPARVLPMPSGGARLRVLPGPQRDELPEGCLESVCGNRFTVSPQSNRVGYRLTGPLVPSRSGDMISDATFQGAIQIPPSGEPILLMADRQTAGGYPQVAIVITADLPIAAQLAPGDWMEFEVCSRDEARRALAEREGMLTGAA